MQYKQGEHTISRIIKPTDNFRPGVEIRLIDAENEQLGVLTIEAALDKAEAAGLDLVLVADKSTPPVCRLMDFKKRQYDAKKAQREAKKKQTVSKLKEVKFRANIDSNDYNIKMNRMEGFLNKGYKVKVSLMLRGREMGFKDKAMELMRKVAVESKSFGELESAPKMVGRNIHMVIGSISRK